jgi:pantetheine-phosphate adenylyltransferase
VTNGHIDVITRAATLFDEVVVAILHNPAKRGTFPVQQREALLRDCIGSLPGVRVALFANTLLVDICSELGATAIVKGLRSGTDFAYELPMALMNRQLTGVETVFLPGDPQFEHVSSSLIKEVHALGGDVAGMVPDNVMAALSEAVPQRPGANG